MSKELLIAFSTALYSISSRPHNMRSYNIAYNDVAARRTLAYLQEADCSYSEDSTLIPCTLPHASDILHTVNVWTFCCKSTMCPLSGSILYCEISSTLSLECTSEHNCGLSLSELYRIFTETTTTHNLPLPVALSSPPTCSDAPFPSLIEIEAASLGKSTI